jgi:hypothetical protein
MWSRWVIGLRQCAGCDRFTHGDGTRTENEERMRGIDDGGQLLMGVGHRRCSGQLSADMPRRSSPPMSHAFSARTQVR